MFPSNLSCVCFSYKHAIDGLYRVFREGKSKGIKSCVTSGGNLSDLWPCTLLRRGSKEAVLWSHHGVQQRSSGHCGTGKCHQDSVVVFKMPAGFKEILCNMLNKTKLDLSVTPLMDRGVHLISWCWVNGWISFLFKCFHYNSELFIDLWNHFILLGKRRLTSDRRVEPTAHVRFRPVVLLWIVE